jgi:hypothetical protein
VGWIGLVQAAILHGLNDWSRVNGHWLWIVVTMVSGVLFLGYAKVGSRGDGPGPQPIPARRCSSTERVRYADVLRPGGISYQSRYPVLRDQPPATASETRLAIPGLKRVRLVGEADLTGTGLRDALTAEVRRSPA